MRRGAGLLRRQEHPPQQRGRDGASRTPARPRRRFECALLAIERAGESDGVPSRAVGLDSSVEGKVTARRCCSNERRPRGPLDGIRHPPPDDWIESRVRPGGRAVNQVRERMLDANAASAGPCLVGDDGACLGIDAGSRPRLSRGSSACTFMLPRRRSSTLRMQVRAAARRRSRAAGACGSGRRSCRDGPDAG